MSVSEINLCDVRVFQEGRHHEIFTRLRNEDPVYFHEDPDGGQGFWCITRHADLVTVNRDASVFSSAAKGINIADYSEEQAGVTYQLLSSGVVRAHRWGGTEGSLVLCVHGLSANSRSFDALAPALAVYGVIQIPVDALLSGPLIDSGHAPSMAQIWHNCQGVKKETETAPIRPWRDLRRGFRGLGGRPSFRRCDCPSESPRCENRDARHA